MFNYKIIYIVFTFIIFSCCDVKIIPDYEKFTAEIGELNYRILYPKNFDESKNYPLTLFLHGFGERGDDNELQLKYIDKVFLNTKKNLSKQLDLANKRELTVAIICGENEFNDNTVTIKNLRGVKGENNQTIPKSNLINEIKKLI